jgi:CSLREA domain-containing protein
MRRYLFVLVALSLAAPTAGAAQTTFIVNTTNDVDDSTCDATHCSLREAIDAANQTAGTDTIAFNIPGGGGVQILSPGSALPVITDPVVIDGTSQPGFSDEPIIGLDGSGAGTVDGLHITAGSSVVRALAIYAFDNGILLDVNGGNTVVASVVGSTGKAVQCEDLGNTAAGIVVQSSDNVIGGASLTLSNEIVCNTTDGIRITNTSGTIVQGNFIGLGEVDDLDDLGLADLGNGRDGVRIESSTDNTIGGTGLFQGNFIVRNVGDGVRIAGAASANNRIAGNTIAQNDGYGILLPDAGTGNEFETNHISDSGQMGIDLGEDGVTENDIGDTDTGPNDYQNYPDISSVRIGGAVYIDGALRSTASTNFSIEIFESEFCDATNHGEGESFVTREGVTTAANGEVDFLIVGADVEPGAYVTATATSNTGNTSEFSRCVQASGFSVTIVPDTTIVNRGGIARYAVEVMPVGGSYNAEVALRCNEKPVLTACTFSQDTVIPGANGVTSFLEIQTSASGTSSLSVAEGQGTGGGPFWPGALVIGLPAIALLGLILSREDRRARRLAIPVVAVLVLAGAAMQAGCSEDGVNGPPGGGTPLGAHRIVVQSKSDPIIQLSTTTLVVTP